MLFLNSIINFTYLLQIQFTGQDYYIGKLRIKFQSFRITDIQLSRQMYLLSYLITVCHDSYVGSNHSANTGFFCSIYNFPHQSQILIINNSIYRKVAFHPILVTYFRNLTQVVNSKRICRTGTHIQAFNAEIDRICSCMNSRSQRLSRADRCHNFEVLY